MSIEKCQREYFDANLWIVFLRKINKGQKEIEAIQETSVKQTAPTPSFYDGTGNIYAQIVFLQQI